MRYLSGLIALINEQLGPDGARDGTTAGVESHYRNTLGMLLKFLRNVINDLYCNTLTRLIYVAEYLRNRQRDAETAERFSAIQMS